MFDRGGLAFSEAGFHATIAIVRSEDSNCTTTPCSGARYISFVASSREAATIVP
jgi:hypothetical protein